MDGFYSWGLPLGSIAGIRIRLHWTLLLFWAWQLDGMLQQASKASAGNRSLFLSAWAIVVGLLFLSILLHELGHSFAARRVGGDAEEILLWPLGGLAFCHCPNHWKSNLIVAAGGPAVSLLIVVVSYLGFLIADHIIPPESWVSVKAWFLFQQVRMVLIQWNLIIFIFNFIPLYPLDGGRVLHSILWGYFSRRGLHGWGGGAWSGYGRASHVTLVVSRITAIAGVAYAITFGELWLLVIFIWALMGAESLRQ